MVYFSSLGLIEDDKLTEDLKNAAYEVPDLIFKGYSCTYYYKNFGKAEFTTALVENDDGTKNLMGLGAHIMGYHDYRMKVITIIDRCDMMCTCLCSPFDDGSIGIAVSFVMSDVLPSILPGDTILFQGIASLYSGRFFSSMAQADRDEEVFEQRRVTGTELGFDPKLIFFKGDGTARPDGLTPIYTKVHGLRRYPSKLQVEYDFPSRPLRLCLICTLEADSTFGEVTIAVAEDWIPPHIINRLENNEDVYMYGLIHFSGDVAIQDYQKGAIFDEYHLLRVLRDSLETGDFKRLEKNLSPRCEYYGYKGRRFSCAEDIIDKIKDVYSAQHENAGDIAYYALATVVDILDPDKVEYEVGKECLIQYSLNSNGCAQCAIFIEVEAGKISKMKCDYEAFYSLEVDKDTYIKAGRPIFADMYSKCINKKDESSEQIRDKLR